MVQQSSNSRQEFLADGEEFRRAGGCFVTTRRAIIFLILAVGLSLLVAVLMYFYGPNINNNQVSYKILLYGINIYKY